VSDSLNRAQTMPNAKGEGSMAKVLGESMLMIK